MKHRMNLLLTFLVCFCFLAPALANYTEILPAVNGMDGSIIINQSEQIIHVTTLEGDYYPGDSWNEVEMCQCAEFGFISFDTPMVKDGYELISATLFYYISECYGDNELFEYPKFQLPSGDINPDCLLTHIDFGASLSPAALCAPPLDTPLAMTNSVTLGWNLLDITHLLQDDIEQNRPFSQYKVSLDHISDWDNKDDYVAIRTSNGNQAPYIFAEYAPVTSTVNDYHSVPVHEIKAYPNPLAQSCNIDIKTVPCTLLDVSIYNLKGQLIRAWKARSSKSGDLALVWDTGQNHGKRVSDGIYLIRVSDGNFSQHLKVLKLTQE